MALTPNWRGETLRNFWKIQCSRLVVGCMFCLHGMCNQNIHRKLIQYHPPSLSVCIPAYVDMGNIYIYTYFVVHVETACFFHLIRHQRTSSCSIQSVSWPWLRSRNVLIQDSTYISNDEKDETTNNSYCPASFESDIIWWLLYPSFGFRFFGGFKILWMSL